MDVLLIQPLAGKGNAGEIIETKIHYANHYLIPNGIAIVYDKQAKNQHAAQMKKVERLNGERLSLVKDVFAKITEAKGVSFVKQTTKEGKLYDSVDAKAISNFIMTTYGLKLPKGSMDLAEKIETIGEYTTTITVEGQSYECPIVVTSTE